MDAVLDKKSKKVIRQLNKELFEQPLQRTVTFSDNLEKMLDSCTHKQLVITLSHYAIMLKVTVEQIQHGIVPLNIKELLEVTGWNPEVSEKSEGHGNWKDESEYQEESGHGNWKDESEYQESVEHYKT